MPDQPKPVPSKKFGPKLLLGTVALTAFLAVWEGGKGGEVVVILDEVVAKGVFGQGPVVQGGDKGVVKASLPGR